MTKSKFLKSLRFSLLANYMSQRLSSEEGNYDKTFITECLFTLIFLSTAL